MEYREKIKAEAHLDLTLGKLAGVQRVLGVEGDLYYFAGDSQQTGIGEHERVHVLFCEVQKHNNRNRMQDDFVRWVASRTPDFRDIRKYIYSQPSL